MAQYNEHYHTDEQEQANLPYEEQGYDHDRDFENYRMPIDEENENFPNYYDYDDDEEAEEYYYQARRPNAFKRAKHYYSSKANAFKTYTDDRIQEQKDYYSEDNDSRWRYYQQSARTDEFIKKVVKVVIILAILSAILFLLNIV